MFRTLNKSQTKHEIAYRWALDPSGYPVPITAAKRGIAYHCPLCEGQMIARLGEQLQHHFGHEDDVGCTPDAVARAALRRWIVIQLRSAVEKHQRLDIEWACSKCGNHHTANLLQDVTQILEGYLRDERYYTDVVTLDAAGNDRMVILIQDNSIPTPEVLNFFIAQDLFTITVPATVTPADADFRSILSQGKIVGAACPMLQTATDIIKDPEAIRKALRDVVAKWPGYFYGSLETVGGLANVLKMGNHYLWLPLDHWRTVIGGTKNPLAPNVQVLMQSWPHPDGGQILLYYAMVRDTAAVGVRRYGPGQVATPYIDQRFRHKDTTALDIVKLMIH
jgi:hypothetical protein